MPRPNEDDHPYGERVLQLEVQGAECKGRDVWELQIKLIGWGSGTDNDGIGNTMDPVRITGTFDTTTRDAVMRFQKAHELPVDGIVDASVFRAIDREAVLHPIVMHDLRCPCATGANDGPILCRCMGMDASTPPQPNQHTEERVCDGFGRQRFPGKFLLEGKKLADNTDLTNEKLDVYDMQEYQGMDKAVLWAARAVLHRAEIQKRDDFKPIEIVAGYRCWHDNYHHTDDTRWKHRRSTFHFGKAIEFFVRDHCTQTKWAEDKASCPQCDAIRKAVQEKCGFQLRWQEPGRVSLAEGTKESRPPSTPFSVHIDTVRRFGRTNNAVQETDEFVKTDDDAMKPLYEGKVNTVYFPVELEPGAGIDPQWAPSAAYFRNAEGGPGGWFPLGLSRLLHGGIHLYVSAGAEVRAIADGEIIGCRAGEAENAQPHGSRNFVLVKHKLAGAGKWKDKEFFSLYLHLDAENPAADAKVPWRRQLFLQSHKHVEALAPCPRFKLLDIGDSKKRFFAWQGLVPGERAKADGAEVAGQPEEGSPPNSKTVKLADLADGYVFTQRDGKVLAKLNDADAALAGKFDGSDVIALTKPIRVAAGDVLGKVAAAAKEDPLKSHGSFLHFETFSAAALPVGDGFVAVAAKDKAKVADRKTIIAALVKAGLVPQPPDDVLLEAEVKELYTRPPYYARLRSAVVETLSAWSIDWKQALQQAECFGFMNDDDRDGLGTAMNGYGWWEKVKAGGGGALPGSEIVFHYNPIALIQAIAYS